MADFILPKRQPTQWDNAGKINWGAPVDPRQFGGQPTSPNALGISVNPSIGPANKGKIGATTPFAPPSAHAAAIPNATQPTGQTPKPIAFPPPLPNVSSIPVIDKTGVGTAPDMFAPPKPVEPIGSGYAMVGGRRINYQDIGTKADPLRKSGGFAAGGPASSGVQPIGGMFAPPDPNVGLAVRDAQDRQRALDISGVGAGGTQPLSLAQRLNQPGASGWGSLITAQVAGKETRDEANRLAANRAFDINSQNAATNTMKAVGDLESSRGELAIKQNTLDMNRQLLPLTMEARRGEINKNVAEIERLGAETKKAKWEISPEGLLAKNATSIKNEQGKRMRDHLIAQGADPGHPENIQRYKQYLADRQNWGDATSGIFNAMNPQAAESLMPLFREYIYATPEQKAILDQRADVKVMKQIVGEIGRRKGYGDLVSSHPAAPVYRHKNVKDMPLGTDEQMAAG